MIDQAAGPTLSRRRALSAAMGATILAACGEANDRGAAVAISAAPPVVLGWLEFVVLAHAAPVVVGVSMDDPIVYARRADAELTAFDRDTQAQGRALVDLVEVYAALNASEGQPFSQMSSIGKQAWLDQLRTSRDPGWRAAYHVMRQWLVSAYYSDAANWDEIGYFAPQAFGEVLDDSQAGVVP